MGIDKSYNKYKKKYRWEKKPVGGKWNKQFEEKWVVLELERHGFRTGNFEFRMKPYRPYFLWLLWWSLLRMADKIRKAIATLTKNPVTSLIIGTLIVYAIMKYILGWI